MIKNLMTPKDVIDLYFKLEELEVRIWIDGGWGVEALLGKQTRSHEDIDIVIQQKDVPKLRKLLEPQGYKDVKLEIARPHNFVLADVNGHKIDVHVIVIDKKGNGIYGPVENGEMYPVDSLAGTGRIENKKVRCISPAWMVKFHSGYELKEKDFQDVSALCEKFNLSLPEGYKRFQK